MILSKNNLASIHPQNVLLLPDQVFELPEKVLQFGTGVLLRGLVDYFIDKANRQGVFNGRVVVVKSTDSGDAAAFEKQDALYTTCVRGLQNGKKTEENIINGSISRVLSSKKDWQQVLKCAHDPEMSIIVSNTTEVGIQLVQDDIRSDPPVSFPGKLLAFLNERFRALGGSKESGMVIVPTELIVDNGKKLKEIVIELAKMNQLGNDFIHWLDGANHFCSSLVDRIVPGKPDAQKHKELETQFGYEDDLMITAEVYRLWAIEGGDHIKSILSFCKVDEGVIIAPDITQFRELKLRMLNATHTLTSGLAFLAGFDTVKEAMDDSTMNDFVAHLMLHDIGAGIPYPIANDTIQEFGKQVLDRFRNPYIQHHWINITLQYTSKIRMRVVPVLLKYMQSGRRIPNTIATGFAAFLLFARPVRQENNKFYGKWGEKEYPIQDDYAPYFFDKSKTLNPEQMARAVLSDKNLWGEDLTLADGFLEAVNDNILLLKKDILKTIRLDHYKTNPVE